MHRSASGAFVVLLSHRFLLQGGRNGVVYFPGGSNDWVRIRNSSNSDLDPGTSSYSISMWFKPVVYCRGGTLLRKEVDGPSVPSYDLRRERTGQGTKFKGANTSNQVFGNQQSHFKELASFMHPGLGVTVYRSRCSHSTQESLDHHTQPRNVHKTRRHSNDRRVVQCVYALLKLSHAGAERMKMAIATL
jgi:hypothetical protein